MKKAGEIIETLFKERFGPELIETARSAAGLFNSWNQVVEEAWFGKGKTTQDLPAAAVHSRICDLERGVLLVEAEHPGWVQILQTKQGELLSAVKRKYPELLITGIAFKLSREPFPSPKPERRESVEDFFSEHSAGHDPPRDEDFYAALKGLEESVKKRNKL